MTRNLLVLFTIFYSCIAYAQFPITDLYLAELKNISLEPKVSAITYLSSFNAGGYTNQPNFFDYNTIYATVVGKHDSIADIIKIKLSNREYTKITNTEAISEFSPSPIIESDQFSVVRIEADGVTQTLWQYPLDRSNKGKRLLKKLNNVGYYCWLSKDKVALFLVGKNNTLAIGDVKNDDVSMIAENIGRCIRSKDAENILFVHKIRPDFWLLKSYNINEKVISTICQMPKGREDFELIGDNAYLAGDGSKIMYYHSEKSSNWESIADLSSTGISNITRLAIARDRLAFVDVKN
ncbi:MAG: hypothetical protein R2774_01010 [Saprospiraceae bacterium]